MLPIWMPGLKPGSEAAICAGLKARSPTDSSDVSDVSIDVSIHEMSLEHQWGAGYEVGVGDFTGS